MNGYFFDLDFLVKVFMKMTRVTEDKISEFRQLSGCTWKL